MPEPKSITELLEADAERVDAVMGPASRIKFLLMKSEDGTLSEAEAGEIAAARAGERIDALLKAQDVPNARIDMPGSPTGAGVGNPELDELLFGALMKSGEEVVDHCSLVNSIGQLKAEVRYGTWEKAKYSADDKTKLLAEGKAMKNAKGDPSYPIVDEEDLSNAIRAVGRGGASHNAVRKYIMKRAKAMGKTSMIPEAWGTDGSLQKATPMYLTLDPNGDPAELPGSPVWETEDSERLIAAGQILAQLINDLQASADRESMEVAVGAADDQQDVWCLDDAICAAEYALGIVAKLAFREEAEAKINPPTGALAKAECSLTDNSVEEISQALSLMKSGELGPMNPAPAGSGSTEEVDDFMSITKDDLAAAVGEGVAAALQKQETDRIERETAANAAAAEAAAKEAEPKLADLLKSAVTEAVEPITKRLDELEGKAPEVKTGDVVKEEGTTENPAEEDLGALLKSTMTEVMAPLDARLAALEGRPATGSLAVGAAGSGSFTPGLRGAGAAGADVPPEISELRGRIQKAEADGDQITSSRLRKELGVKVLGHAYAERGYPTNAARGRAAQFTDNAAAR